MLLQNNINSTYQIIDFDLLLVYIYKAKILNYISYYLPRYSQQPKAINRVSYHAPKQPQKISNHVFTIPLHNHKKSKITNNSS